MGAKITISSTNLNKNSLDNSLKQFHDYFQDKLLGIVQSVEFMADISTKECAEELLRDSLELVPVEKNLDKKFVSPGTSWRMARWESFKHNSELFKRRVDELKINVERHITAGEYIQFRNADGTYGKRNYIERDPETRQRLFEHTPGALKDSGRVDSIRDDKNDNHQKIIGYRVSYDTRRTDTRSFANNFNYAVKQHEDATFHHEQGTHHFLSTPYGQKRKQFLDKLADSAREAIEKGAKKK